MNTTPVRNPPQATWEGQLQVRLRVQAGRIQTVQVHSTRRVEACRVFIGKPVRIVPRLMPLLYSVCGHAQKTAALLACEAALGVQVAPSVQRLRWIGLLAEVLREHLLYWTMGWGDVLEKDTDKATDAALRSPPDWTRLLPPLKALQGLCDEPTEAAAAIEQGDALLDGLQPTHEAIREVTARWCEALLQHRQDRHHLGDSTVPGLPNLDADNKALWLQYINNALLNEAHFAEKPHDQGQVYETGCLARMQQHPWVAAAIRQSGRGLKARLLARQCELSEIYAQMQRALQSEAVSNAASVTWLDHLAPAPGIGISAVETARGRLVHRVEVDRTTGHLRRYQIVAPTEWNFHPAGALVEGLQGHRVPDPETAWRDTQDVIRSLDPCVGYHIEVEDES